MSITDPPKTGGELEKLIGGKCVLVFSLYLMTFARGCSSYLAFIQRVMST